MGKLTFLVPEFTLGAMQAFKTRRRSCRSGQWSSIENSTLPSFERQGDRLLGIPTSANPVFDNCPLFGFDSGVPGAFDLVQEPAQSAMAPGEAGGRLLCILPEVHGAAASIDGAAIIAEAVAPGSGEASQLVNSVKAPSEAHCCRRHHLRQRQTVDPRPDDRGQLGRGSYSRQLCNHLIEIRGHAPGDEKPQAIGKTIQFARPIRHGERQWSPQRLWQVGKNRDSQVIDLCRVVQDLAAVRISEQEHEPLIILLLQGLARQPMQGSPDAERTMPQHLLKNLPRRAMGEQPTNFRWLGTREMRQAERDQMHSRLTYLEQVGEQAGLGVHHDGQRFCRPAKRAEQKAGVASFGDCLYGAIADAT